VQGASTHSICTSVQQNTQSPVFNSDYETFEFFVRPFARTARRPYSDEKVASPDVSEFRWEIAHEAVSRRPPNSLDTMVPRTSMYTYAAKVGICLPFKDHSLSRRAKP
jgi:hypothetical protein